MALLILFGFGLETLFRVYLKDGAQKAGGLKESFAGWWKTANLFERRWVRGSIAFMAAVFLATLAYTSSKAQLTSYLREAGFADPAFADQIAAFSFSEAWYAVGFTGLAIALVIVAMSGWFSGRRVALFVGIAGVFLAVDLMRADRHWVVYYNYKKRYASNAVIDFLKDKSYEHRVTARVAPFSDRHFVDQNTGMFMSVANLWLQHHFQYYNIQSLEPVQMPRMPELDKEFSEAMVPTGTNRPPSVLARMWELSNTRYFIGSRQALASIGPQLGKPPFKILLPFDLTPKPGAPAENLTIDDVDWVKNENGRFAIAEYPDVLPRAQLFTSWQETTNDVEVLDRLASPQFDPHTSVFINGPINIKPTAATNSTGAVTISKYTPKQIELTASNSAPAILLYNDRFSPNWRAWVDGKEENLLRANFIMRGIALPPGNHTIVMKYAQPTTALKISLVCLAAGFVILGFLAVRSSPDSKA
jgi:hypothetical protein